ncbi:MAG: hypothetical protein R3Y53_03975 [Bacillota bacterium]
MADFIQKMLAKAGIAFGNTSDYPIMSNHYFAIFGKAVVSFSKISGITLLTNKNSAVSEGGRFEPYITTEPVSELSTMTLEKGFGTLDLLSIANKSKSFILVVRGDDHAIKNVYYTDRMSVDKMTISDLDAKSSTVLVQNITISYTYLRPMPDLVDMLPSSVASVLSAAGLDNASLFNAISTEGSTSDLSDQIAGSVLKTGMTEETATETTEDTTADTAEDTTYLGENDADNIASDTERIKAEKEAKRNEKLANQDVQSAVDANSTAAEQEKERADEEAKASQEKASLLEELIQL